MHERHDDSTEGRADATRRGFLRAAGVGALGITATAAAGTGAAQESETGVRVIHASPDTPAVDVYVDGTAVLTDVEFGAVSDFLGVDGGYRYLEVTPAGEPAYRGPIRRVVQIPDEGDYTLAVVGELDGDEPLRPAASTDDRSEVADGDSRVKLLHASPDAGAVDVTTAGGTTLVSGAELGDAAEATVPAGEYTLQVRPAASEPDYEGWFSDVSNYDGTVDRTGRDEVTVDVGAAGNGGRLAFGPAAVRVDPGTTVAWEWTGRGGRHNVVAEDGGFVSGGPVVSDEERFEYTFEESGVYEYYCSPHRGLGMKGAVVVGSPDPVFEADIDLAGGERYTAPALGYLSTDDEPADEPFRVAGLPAVERPTGEGEVRVVHASPDTPAVDVYVDGENPEALSGVTFGDVGDYLALPAGERRVQVTPAGADPDAGPIDETVTVEADTSYTLAAVGELDGDEPLRPAASTDDRSEVADDESRVKLLHASPDAGAVDVRTASGTTLVSGAELGDAAEATVPAGEYTLEVSPVGTDATAAVDVDLAGGERYTALALGYLTADDEPVDEPFRLAGVPAAPVEAPVVDERPATDPDGDGVYEDLNGNGRVDYDDVVVLFRNLDSEAVTDDPDAFDLNGNGRVDYDDVVQLFDEI